MSDTSIELESQAQLNAEERRLLSETILNAEPKPKVVIEVGTWLGGGSTTHILRALEKNNAGHLWGIEADRSIYERMITNIRAAAPSACARFTPLFGFSEDVIPAWLREQSAGFEIDIAFLDGGNNPMEQVTEFFLVNPCIPVGGTLMTHDAKLRKGKWLVPYLSALDNWKWELHDVSEEGLFIAKKIAVAPSPEAVRRAESRLRRMRLEPAEVAAALLSSSLAGFILKLVPLKLRRRLAEGRR